MGHSGCSVDNGLELGGRRNQDESGEKGEQLGGNHNNPGKHGLD